MFRCITALLLAATIALLACSPTFNWREVHVEPAGLKAMFPCKPEHASRSVAMAGSQVSLEALACDAGGSTFAVLFADIGSGPAGEVLGQWQAATLATLHGSAARKQPFRLPGALELPQSLQMRASGQRADASPVQADAAYFAHGHDVFQAVVYAATLKPEATEPFFSGLAFE